MYQHVSRIIVGLVVVLACSLAGLDARARELSFDALKRDLRYVLELIAKRSLSDQEVGRAASEFAAHFDGRCDKRCLEAVELNKRLVEPMVTLPGTPRDLLARQWFSRELYFSPPSRGASFKA